MPACVCSALGAMGLQSDFRFSVLACSVQLQLIAAAGAIPPCWALAKLGLRTLLTAAAIVDDASQATTNLPRKRFYRARAHSNPLNDSSFDVPAHPDDASW